MNNNFTSLHHLKRNEKSHLANACASSNTKHLETVDYYGNTALLKACYLGDVEAVRILLSYNVNLHAINYFGQNALTLATYAGCYDTVSELFKYRSYNDFTLSSIIPPLCVAALKGHHHLVELFQNIHPDRIGIRTVHGLSAGELQNMRNWHSRECQS